MKDSCLHADKNSSVEAHPHTPLVQVGRWRLLVVGLLILLWHPAVLAQHKVVDSLILNGNLAQAVDSLGSSTLTENEKERYQMRIAIELGNPETALEWYGNLSKREQRTPENMALATRASLFAYHLDEAQPLLEQLEKNRTKKEHIIKEREELKELYQHLERLLRNSKKVTQADTITGQDDAILRLLQQETNHLGIVERDAYTSPSGDIKWKVIRTSGVPTFAIVKRLGDGSWDEANAQLVEIKGLETGGQLSYPFLNEDGSTLYFSFKGKGAVGRADLYVSRYNRGDHTLLVPQQLPLPFNSNADDLIYLPDDKRGLVWLVTDRGLPIGYSRLFIIPSASILPIPNEATKEERSEWAALRGYQEVSYMREPQQTSREVVVQEQGEVIFWYQGKPICTVADLPNNNEQAQQLFGQLLSLHNEQSRDLSELARLRNELRTTTSPHTAMRERILALEEMVAKRYPLLQALRNEVIQAINLR